MGLAVARDGLGFDAAHVADAAAAVIRRVAVQRFAPEAAVRNADAVVAARHRGEVEDDERLASQECQNALLPVAAPHPAESFGRKVVSMQGSVFRIEAVEVGHPALYAAV